MPIYHAFCISLPNKTKNNKGKVINSWKRLTLDKVSWDDLAKLVAQHIMKTLFGGNQKILDAWENKCTHNHSHSEQNITDQLNDVLSRQIGIPSDQEIEKKSNSLEGFVAEHLWHLTTLHHIYDIPHVYLHDIDFRVTSPGADGFVIYKNTEGGYYYRLWEVKKNNRDEDHTGTSKDACEQLDYQATCYLQEISKLGEHHSNTSLKDFYSEIMFHWRNASPEANAGIALIFKKQPPQAKPFNILGSEYLSKLAGEHRLNGLLIELGDVSEFAKKVRQEIWNGL